MKPIQSLCLITKPVIDHFEDEQEHQREIMQAWDDVSGLELNPSEVVKAREKEMEYVNKKQI